MLAEPILVQENGLHFGRRVPEELLDTNDTRDVSQTYALQDTTNI
jgi:hypothetical protein